MNCLNSIGLSYNCKRIVSAFSSKACLILAPLVKNRKGHYRELFENIRKKGYSNVRVDGTMQEITLGMKLDRYKNHDIEVVIDKIVVDKKDTERIAKSILLAMKLGEGVMMIMERDSHTPQYFSSLLICPKTGLANTLC